MNFLALACAPCTSLLVSRDGGLADYVEQRMLVLRYGCLCRRDRELRCSREIADILGLSVNFVRFRHRRWRKNGCRYLSALEKTERKSKR
jgi:transposase